MCSFRRVEATRPAQDFQPTGLTYYAHTANSDPLRLERGEGKGEVSSCSPLRSSQSGLESRREGWQPLNVHLSNVARLAKGFGALFGLAAEAERVGLLHDLGKYAERFQARLRNPAIQGINHWAAGTAQAASVKAWAVAFAADGHHTGIPALNDNTAGISLRQTVAKFASPETRSELTGQCPEDLEELLARFANDNLQLPPFSPRPIEDRFAEALRTRMLLSCLVDADRLDTEQHFDAIQSGQRAVPELRPEQALAALQRDLQSKSSDGPVNALRRQLLQDCLNAAEKPPGLFTLTAPTGSGKTLSSLAFALNHIAHHNAALTTDDPRRFHRVIVVNRQPST